MNLSSLLYWNKQGLAIGEPLGTAEGGKVQFIDNPFHAGEIVGAGDSWTGCIIAVGVDHPG